MAIALDKSASGIFNTTTSSNVSFGTTPAAGSMVTVGIGAWRTDTLPAITVSDNQGNTYSLVTSQVTGGNQAGAYLYRAYNVTASGTFTVTVAPASATDITVSIASWTDVYTAGSPNDGSTQAIATSTSADSGSITTTDAGDIVIGVLSHAGSNATLTEGGTYTLLYENEGGSTNAPISVIYKLPGSTGSYNATWTIANTVTWLALIAAFKPAATTGQPAQPRGVYIPGMRRAIGAI